MTLKFSIKKPSRKHWHQHLYTVKKVVLATHTKKTVLALKKVSVKYKIKTFFCLFFLFWYFDWFLLSLPLKSMSKCQSNLFSSKNVSMPKVSWISSGFTFQLFPLIAVRFEEEMWHFRNAQTCSFISWELSYRPEPPHAVWLCLPLQFKTDALHQHWQHRRAWGRQLFWVN